MHLFSFTWIALFSIHLLEMTRQLPPGPDRCLAKLPKIRFYGFLFVLTFSVASMMIRWTDCDFSRWDTTADKATPITIILLASFDCFPPRLWIMWLFPQDDCCLFTAMSCCFMSCIYGTTTLQLRSKWFDPWFCSKKASCTREPMGPPLRKCCVPSSIKALLFMLMLIQPSSQRVPIN